jgi:CO dehydrogenase nickel-insertion accessory protein CooC1
VNLGLGNSDVLFSNKCAHGLSGPLKYYLGLLEEKDSFVVIDSVAGTDMLNFGLYSGIDAVIGVVEPHRNSFKVFEQIHALCKKTMVPCFAVVNKPTDNEFYNAIKKQYSECILGEIPFDENILNYEFEKLHPGTKAVMKEVLSKVSKLSKKGNLKSMQEFHSIKKSKF